MQRHAAIVMYALLLIKILSPGSLNYIRSIPNNTEYHQNILIAVVIL